MNTKKSQVRDYAISIIAAVVIAITFRTYVFARADVDGLSMYSTLNNKDVLFVEKISNLTHSFKRGQIIIFDSKNYNSDIYVKRIIGLPGDEIEIKNGKIYLNAAELKEDYLDSNTFTSLGPFLQKNGKYTVENGHVFVLGDNRNDSIDSRMLGPINIKDIKGHAIVRVYPFNKIRTFK
ncbi:signal peptidase I [Clostridium swellfunianum]|uniref:signal peptidase I n=1 Tax=Clostridium swellfunianum TaxID=1367462 RepID=UPI00202F2A66|nr:signal peptidase I [Clostridium swellfunianum]MCM0649831.1 signal peptidase I [Clostridium swellfunianum]